MCKTSDCFLGKNLHVWWQLKDSFIAIVAYIFQRVLGYVMIWIQCHNRSSNIGLNLYTMFFKNAVDIYYLNSLTYI